MNTELTDRQIESIANIEGMDDPAPCCLSFARAIIAADRAQRQVGQEPVVWRYKNTESVVAAMAGYKPGADWGPLYAAPQPADTKGASYE